MEEPPSGLSSQSADPAEHKGPSAGELPRGDTAAGTSLTQPQLSQGFGQWEVMSCCAGTLHGPADTATATKLLPKGISQNPRPFPHGPTRIVPDLHRAAPKSFHRFSGIQVRPHPVWSPRCSQAAHGQSMAEQGQHRQHTAPHALPPSAMWHSCWSPVPGQAEMQPPPSFAQPWGYVRLAVSLPRKERRKT